MGDHGFTRQMEPWEMSDGCIFLLRELSLTNESAAPIVFNNLQKMCDLGLLDHFKHAQNLKENLFKSLKDMVSSASGFGKKKYRSSVEMFLEPTFRNASAGESSSASY